MTVNKRKKNSRQRGSMTHGWGSKKKHRGAGNRGGRGMAGTGKRADSKKPTHWKGKYFGKSGFTSKKPKIRINAINISFIEQHIDKFLSKNLAKKEGSHYIIDLENLGFNKLLGNGRVSVKFKIKTPYASETVTEKVKESGGEVTGLAKSENK